MEGTHKILSSEQLKPISDFNDVVKQQSPEWQAKMNDLMQRIINAKPEDDFRSEYKKLMGEANQIYNDYKNGKGKPVLNNYDALLGGKAADYRAKRVDQKGYSLSKRAEDITKAYADLYQEIIVGHKDGTRKSYMLDSDSESGYREMTLEEELAALDKAFEKQTEKIDKQVKQNDDLTKALKAYSEQLAKAKRNKNAEDVLGEYEARLKEQSKIPGNLAEKMHEVAKMFKDTFEKADSEAFELLPKWTQENFFVAK